MDLGTMRTCTGCVPACFGCTALLPDSAICCSLCRSIHSVERSLQEHLTLLAGCIVQGWALDWHAALLRPSQEWAQDARQAPAFRILT